MNERQRKATVLPHLTSSVLTEATYDWSNKHLDIVFTSGRRYRYAGVPEAVYDALLAAPSKGAFFNEFIRDVYRATEISARRGRGRRSPA